MTDATDRSAAGPDEEAVGVDRPGLHPSDRGRPRNESFGAVLDRSLARRSFLLGAAASVPVLLGGFPRPAVSAEIEGLGFKPIAPSKDDRVVTPEGYRSSVVVKWGDPLFADSAAFDVDRQSAETQRGQFGFNNDFVGFFPLDRPDRALLVVNHEYTAGADMIPGYAAGAAKAHADIEIAAHGGSVVEIRRDGGTWTYVKGAELNRRIHGDTPMRLAGPAAGHALMKTSADPDGRTVLGMLNNCSGGKTPWGTWLTCEENINYYFANNDRTADPAIKAVHKRYGVKPGATDRRWEAFYPRFDVSQEPHEPFRFGWVIEIDPYDPSFTPLKRTALGRVKHEAATVILAADNRAVVYTGDDQQFDYVYKFVSKNAHDPARPRDSIGLLDEGTLYVARFADDNSGEWLPLDVSNPALAGRFADQGELLIKTRLAADLVGATAMDRPEDCQPNPVNGRVYLTMTNNTARKSLVADAGGAAANPRIPNRNGHIIELAEEGGDHAATRFSWEIFLLCGDPAIDLRTDAGALRGLPQSATFFAGYADPSRLGKIGSPDNIAFDSVGNLWIATDGQPECPDIGQPNDALHVVPTAGPERGRLRQFLSGPKGCEVCGPEFSDDGETVFCAIQHPGEEGGYPNRVSSWPDGGPLPRPAVVAVTAEKGGKISA